MRISTSMIYDAGIGTMNRQWAEMLHLQQQVASNRRILTPADDPIAAARALEVQQAKDINTQYATNQDNAKSTLGLVDGQLAGVTDMFGRLKELVVQAGGPSLTDANRKSLATELRAHFDRLLGMANSTDGSGQHLFSGYMGATQPFSGTPDTGVSYAGDDGQRKLQVASGRQIEVSDAGSDIFERIDSGNGTFSTTYVAGNTGTGVIDAGTVTNPAAWVSPASGSYTIQFSVVGGVTNYQVNDGGTIVTAATPYVSGKPIALPGGHVTATGAPANGDAFAVTTSSNQSIFATMAGLIKTLETGTATAADMARYQSDLKTANINLDQGMQNILRVRAAVGSRLSEIDTLGSVNSGLDLQYQQTLSNLQDLDYAATLSALTRKQADLEAAQKSFLSTSKLSLFNYL